MEMSPYSLDACTGVCHRFYRLAIPIKYRSVHVSNGDWCRKGKRVSKKGSQIPLFVRRIVLDDRHHYGSDDAKPLIDVVRATKKLKEIVIYGSYQFSQPLLDLINAQFPDIKIEYHADIPREEDGWYEGWGSNLLEGGGMNGFRSPQLHDLRIDGHYYADELVVARRSLEKIIKNAPNLRHFTTYLPAHTTLELNFSHSDRLPVLKSFENIKIAHRDLEIWAEVAGWDSLYILKLVGVSDVPPFATYQLPKLQYLTISGYEIAAVYDKLPAVMGPVRFLSIGLDEDQLPFQFLAQFTNTLEELMIVRNRGSDSDRGFAAPDVRRLNEVCPSLKKLYIRPFVTVVSPQWSPDFLEELGHYQNLECLVLGHEGYSKVEPNPIPEPSPSQCLEALKSIRGSNPSSKLRTLGVIHEYDATRCDYFRSLGSYAKVLCKATQDGQVKIEEKSASYYYDYGNKTKNEKEAAARSLESRPFSKYMDYIWDTRTEAEVLYTIKKLKSWAEKELLPQGLIKLEHLEQTHNTSNGNFMKEIDEIIKDKKRRRDCKELIKEELKYWNRVWQRREKYGRHATLYDVLYPRDDVD